MNKDLFNYIDKHSLFNKYVKVLDWIFDDNKFDNPYWNRRKTIKYTKVFKKYCDNNNIEYKNDLKNIISNNKLHIYIIDKNNIKDVIRHIRNSIAHKQTTIIKIKNKDYMFIKSISRNRIMADMYIELEMLIYLYNLYIIIKKECNEISNNKELNVIKVIQ